MNGSAWEKGIIYDYPDGSLQPDQAVNRSELAIIVSHLNNNGLVNLLQGESLQPSRTVRRSNGDPRCLLVAVFTKTSFET